MQRHTELNSQESSSHQCDPGCEVTVVHVDMLHPETAQLFCVVRAEQGVKQSAGAFCGAFASLAEYSPQKVADLSAFAHKHLHCAAQQSETNGLQKDSLTREFPKRRIDQRYTPSTTWDNFHAAPAQLSNFFDHVPLDGGRELVRNVCDSWQKDYVPVRGKVERVCAIELMFAWIGPGDFCLANKL